MNNPSKVDIVIQENTIDINGFSIEHFLTPIKIAKALGEPERIYNNSGRNLKFSGAYIYDRLGTSFAISHERTSSIRLRYGIAEDTLLHHSSSIGHVFKGSLTIGQTKFPEPKKLTRRPKIRDKYLEEFENSLYFWLFIPTYAALFFGQLFTIRDHRQVTKLQKAIVYISSAFLTHFV